MGYCTVCLVELTAVVCQVCKRGFCGMCAKGHPHPVSEGVPK